MNQLSNELIAEDKLILSVAKIHPSQDDLKALDASILEVTDWDKV